MTKSLEFLFGFIFLYLPTIYFIALKLGFLTRGGCLYNWVGAVPHTMWFLLILSVNSLEFLFILHWALGWWAQERYR